MFKTKGQKLIIISLFFSVIIITGAIFIEEILILTKKIEKQMKVFAQEILPLYLKARYPDRLIFIVSELDLATQELAYFAEQTETLIGGCNCANMKSICKRINFAGCNSIGVFGDPCPNRKEIEKKQSEIKDKLGQIKRLRGLLAKEIDIYSEQEKETLEDQIGEDLFNKMNNFIEKIDKDILQEEKKLLSLEPKFECSAQCSLQPYFEAGFGICLKGKQDPIILKFRVDVNIDDLEIGTIKEDIVLNFPEKINIGKIIIPDSIDIPLSEVVINFPEVDLNAALGGSGSATVDLSTNPLVFYSPSLPPIQKGMNLCPPSPYSKFPQLKDKYSPSSETKTRISEIETNWYSQNLEWLSSKCLGIFGFGENRIIGTSEAKNLQSSEKAIEYYECFDPEKVVDAIINGCNKYEPIWVGGCTEFHIPQFCRDIRFYCHRPHLETEKKKKASKQCENLFKHIGKKPPEKCYYYNDPLGTLKNECEDIKKDLRQKEEGEQIMPDPCKYIPIFDRNFSLPQEFRREKGKIDLSGDIIGDFPRTIPGCQEMVVGTNKITLPKIDLPDIIIPDISLPRFNFCPIASVRLPTFIFEDLILPDINLCDIDSCLGYLPDLDLSLDIPPLIFPQLNFSIEPLSQLSLTLNIAGYGNINTIITLPKIELNNLSLPPINFSFLNQLNLLNLMIPQLQIPQISLPTPQFSITLSGIEINFFNILLGLIMNFFGLDSFCLSGEINISCLTIDFNNYIFSWPGFPEIHIPPFCEEINGFCSKIKDKFSEISKIKEYVSQIKKVINSKIYDKINEINSEINNAIVPANSAINQEINNQLSSLQDKIIDAVEEHIKENARIEGSGILKIPPKTINLGSINIKLEELQNIVDKIEKQINIDWPLDFPNKISFEYDIPDIPLSELSWGEEIPIKVPGLQLPSVDITNFNPPGLCTSLIPQGTVYLEASKKDSIENINSKKKEISIGSQEIINLLR